MPSDAQPEWMVAADEAILADLLEQRLDYVPLVSSRCGLHLSFAERRCEILADQGYLERATSEVTYRITERGERHLHGKSDQRSADAEPEAAHRI